MNLEVKIDEDDFMEKYGLEFVIKYFTDYSQDTYGDLKKLEKELNDSDDYLLGLWSEFFILWEDNDEYIKKQGDDLSVEEIKEIKKRRKLLRELSKQQKE